MLKAPSAKTLKRYGMSEMDWNRMAQAQGGVCAICRRLPGSGRLMVDHEHVPKWAKLGDPARFSTVRGLLCFRDNYHFTAKGMTLDRARNLVQYLERYETSKKRSGHAD